MKKSKNIPLEQFKTKLYTTLLLLLFVLVGNSQRGVRIGHIDTEYILENISDLKQAQQQLESKATKWKTEVDRRNADLENQRKQLEAERVLLTNELIEERLEELQIIEDELLEYQQKRFGPNGDLMIQKKQLIQPIQDQIFTAVQEIATTKKYDFIFDKSADVVMLFSADRYDVSEQVLQTINRSSKRIQIKNKKGRKKVKEEENIVEVDNDNDEQQKLIDDRNAKRAEALVKRKADLEAKRAARKEEIKNKKQKKSDGKAHASMIEASTSGNLNEDLKKNNTIKDNITSNDSFKDTELVEENDKRSKISDREARKKALEEKKKRILANRKAKLEALKRKRDSIKNNRK